MSLDRELYIEKYSLTNYLLCCDGKKEKRLINSVSFEILKRIDGTREATDLIEDLANLYREKKDVVEENLKDFFNIFINVYGYKIHQSECKQKKPVRVIGKASYYPKAASVEITECCNLNCLHCYGSFGDHKNHTMSLADVKKILKDLSDVGVRTLELTGGDISTHPNLKEIILYALKLDFEQIDLLSNGVILKEDILDIAVQNSQKIVVQIDLHSLDDDYLFWFTQRKDTLTTIKNKIEYLSNHGVRMRVATIFTKKNLHELCNIAEWVSKRNVSWGVGVVERLGRALNSDSDLYLNAKDWEIFQSELEVQNKKYPGMISIIDYQPNENNCGAMTTHVVINPYGQIKLCTMDDGSYFKNSLGNCLDNNIRSYYDKNIDFIRALTFYQLPDVQEAECEKCSEFYACGHCMLRHFINIKERSYRCKWYKEHMPNVMKKFFFENGMGEIE